ncbi:unnamed protein product [Schistosoma guineensis]|nr:unnamed protein product [Schistosoma guineensis]
MYEKCSIINEFIKCKSKLQFKGAFILIIVGLILGFVIFMIRKLHRPTLINTIIAGITANLLSFGVALFCGFFEFKYVVMDAIVSFVLVIGFLSIVLSYFYCIFEIVFNTCWICLILLAIVFTPYYFYLNNESTEYSSYLIGFINVFEIITLNLFALITSLDIGQTTLKCDYGGNE